MNIYFIVRILQKIYRKNKIRNLRILFLWIVIESLLGGMFMLFKDFKYERPDFEEINTKANALLDTLEVCDNAQEFISLFHQINQIRNDVSTMSVLSSIRHTIDTSDEFYNAENDYWDEYAPLYAVIDNRLSKIALSKPYREELLKEIPSTYFQLAECAVKSFDERIIPLLQQENKLTSQYSKLKASARIEFDGEILNLSQISAKGESMDRDVRKRAFDANVAWYEEHEAEFDRIYDELVHLRDQIAKELGYDNFIELGYYRMSRLDYNADMVSVYRREILNHVTPTVAKFIERQKKRLGYSELMYYDFSVKFKTGNPTPKGSYDELIEACKTMYHEMSPETKEFIDILIQQELWDLKNRPNKAGGGYCTSLANYKVPFIFANFNGTSHDVDVLTHEAGHAFQAYMSRDITTPECLWPTYESCEIHSMSMEFFAWPWMKSFFKEDTEKYYFHHISGAISFLPYGVLVDHFQHEVYKHVDYTPKQRKEVWRNLEKQYLPWKQYKEDTLFEKGGFWFQQGHIFESPFYYIDYTLAQVCALQFWLKMQNKDVDAWNDYVRLCKAGGTKSFTQLVELANLKSPFKEGCLVDVITTANTFLDRIDDTKL